MWIKSNHSLINLDRVEYIYKKRGLHGKFHVVACFSEGEDYADDLFVESFTCESDADKYMERLGELLPCVGIGNVSTNQPISAES